MQTHIDLKFGDGDYTFRLKLPQIVEIERKCGPVGEVYARLLQGRYTAANGASVGIATEGAFRVADCIEVIRQSLIGGGMGTADAQPVVVTPTLANSLIDAYVVGRPMREAWDTATAIMGALVEGYQPPGEADAGPAPAKPAPRKRSSGAKSSPIAT